MAGGCMTACQNRRVRLDRPRLEGTVAVRDGRRLGFAEFGTPRGRAVIWMHGTPGARRQIPVEARAYAAENDLRIIGLDRPGVGVSTPHLYADILDWTDDLRIVADVLSIDTMRTVGLSGGGPYALAAGAAMPDRVHSVGVLGGVAPTVGLDAINTGLIGLAHTLRAPLEAFRVPLGVGVSAAIRLLRPVAGPVIDTYAAFQPRGDRELLQRPEFRAMFVEDLVGGTKRQFTAPISDAVLFTRHWGFDLSEVTVPVHWWHGNKDHIVPFVHGQHVVDRLPNATLSLIDGESHLGGMALANEVLTTLFSAE